MNFDRRQNLRRATDQSAKWVTKEDNSIEAASNKRGRPYSVVEAGRLLGIGRGLAYELVRLGKIPSLRLGKRRVVPRAVVDALLSAPEIK